MILLWCPGRRGMWPLCPQARLLGQQGQHKATEFLRTSVRRCEAAQAALCTAGFPRAYGDPKLRGRRAYAHSVGQLKDRKLIDFVRSCLEMVDVFFVTKSKGRQRLVVDCRLSNCWFADAEHTPLCSGDTLASVELSQGEDLFLGQADLSDAFYHIGLPLEFRKYFGLRPVRAGDVKADSIDGRPVGGWP